MTIAYLPGPSDDVPPYEPWAGESEVLAEAASAGRRAAAWIRSLPGPPAPGPVGAWLTGELSGAVETAMGSLDPAACDRMVEGRIIDGTGGVDAGTMGILAAVPCVLSEVDWLAPDQHIRILAVASVVTGTVRLLADDPSTAITRDVARMCAILDHAARPDGPGGAAAPGR
ncbi:hypothetical protein [Streptomyces sp. NPDC058011]|uniref:hypothetical protein n=1 Tax=Streptomyces sp. NPDC058011 TaxID=3346305 RepID=UPI0036EC6DF5